MKSNSGDASSYNGRQLPAPFNHRQSQSADSRGQNRHGSHRGDDRRVRQTSSPQVRDNGGRHRPSSASSADSKRRAPVAGHGRRVHVVPPPSYYNSASPTTRHRSDVFVVPASPVSLPPSARLDRIISSDDHGDVASCDAATTDDDERRLERRTIFGAVLRRRSLIVAVICIVAFLSPIVMVCVPRPSAVADGDLSKPRRPTSDSGYRCDEDCEFAILSLSVRLIVVAIGWLAVFTGCRMWSSAELPRLENVETTLTSAVLLIGVVFWSFYAVRIAGQGVYADADYERTVSFAGSMADTLLYVHGLAALVLGLRCRTTSVDLVVHVVCSSDGRSTTFSASSMSVQQLALLCLRRCCVELSALSDKPRDLALGTVKGYFYAYLYKRCKKHIGCDRPCRF